MFMFMTAQQIWERITSDVEFMNQHFDRDENGQHYLKAHLQRKHKEHLRKSVTWSLERHFDMQMREAPKHIPQKLPYMHHVYPTVTHYFEELRQTANIPGAAFWWPSNTQGFNLSLIHI